MTLLQTDFLPNKSETFQAFRSLLQMTPIQPGVVGATDFKASQHAAGANMSVDIAAGDAWIAGTSVARQGLYHQANDAALNPAVTASDPTNPRLDQVILVVNDSAIAGGSDTPALVVVAGTPTAGTTLDNRNGAISPATMNATWPNRILLADLLIPAASSSVITANIRDRRPWARGAHRRLLRNTGTNVTVGTSTALVDAAIAPRIECSGVALRMKLLGLWTHSSSATGALWIYPRIDGVDLDGFSNGHRWQVISLGGGQDLDVEWETVPAAGSHIIAPYAATNTPSATIYDDATTSFIWAIEEIVKQDADNT